MKLHPRVLWPGENRFWSSGQLSSSNMIGWYTLMLMHFHWLAWTISSTLQSSQLKLQPLVRRAYWISQPFVQSGGPMVIDPRKIFYERDFSKPMDASVGKVDGEMDWVNSQFRDRIDVLDGFYALLIGEWCEGDGIYQYWQKQFGKGPDWLLENAAMVHFIADWKPWRITTESLLKERCPKYQPQLLQVFQRWWSAKAKVCWRWKHQWNPTWVLYWAPLDLSFGAKNLWIRCASGLQWKCTCFQISSMFKIHAPLQKKNKTYIYIYCIYIVYPIYPIYIIYIYIHTRPSPDVSNILQLYFTSQEVGSYSSLILNHGIALTVQQLICLLPARKTNISPENQWLEDVFPSEIVPF